MPAAEQGLTAINLKGLAQSREYFSLRALLSDSCDGIVDPSPSTCYIFGAVEEGIGEGGVAVVDTSGSQSVLFSR